jgi:ribosomal protein S21
VPLDVHLHDGETQESLLKRFQQAIQFSGVLREAKAKRFFVSRGDAARIKAKAAARRRRRQAPRGIG